MQRTTIDFGIDLGTTNSTIAMIDGTDASVIPNKVGSSVTPSAVWLDKRDRTHVGQEAKERTLTVDPDNGDLEFKLRMGLGPEGQKSFARSGRVMLPEELSAEVLKSLKTDVRTNLGEEIRAAVITVPAAFELPQTDATQKSAKLAGFVRSPLLLEPVAASLAYGFQSSSENVYWLVFDFGGGTFDSAVMRVRDGMIQVINHDGDNHLGGKLIDWDIVTKQLIPALAAQASLPDLRRGNPRWRGPIGRLKYAAEKAKIEVCRTREASEVWIEDLCEDAEGKSIDFAFTLTPEHVEEITRPYVERALALSRRTLDQKGLQGSDLERVLMVGGTTLNPWMREAVESELGCSTEYGFDPVTVVARGAAIFAATQNLPADTTAPVPAGAWRIEIEHEPVGNVTDPDIGGRLVPPRGTNPRDHTIELVDELTRWRSGRLPLGEDGVFLTQLFAEENRRCRYAIVLCDPTGTRIPTLPDHVVYTLGIVPDRPPAPNSLGVGLANDEMKTYIEKGTKLPARQSVDHRTAVALHAGRAEDSLTIPVLEGENLRATRNHGIGELVIRGSDIRRDLPTGSPVEITILLDESQSVKVQAFVPTLDEEFEVAFDLRMETRPVEELRREASAQKERLEGVRAEATRTGESAAGEALAPIIEQGLVEEVDSLIDAAGEEPDARSQLDRRLRDLTAAIDRVEDALEWPVLLEKAEESRSDAAGVVEKYGDTADRSRLETLEGELARARETRDADLLRHYRSELDGLWFVVLDRQPGFHVARLDSLAERLSSMRDGAQAEQLVAQGRRAIKANDVQALRAANRQLVALLPSNEQKSMDRRVGGII